MRVASIGGMGPFIDNFGLGLQLKPIPITRDRPKAPSPAWVGLLSQPKIDHQWADPKTPPGKHFPEEASIISDMMEYGAAAAVRRHPKDVAVVADGRRGCPGGRSDSSRTMLASGKNPLAVSGCVCCQLGRWRESYRP